jgi:hypothetical protein
MRVSREQHGTVEPVEILQLGNMKKKKLTQGKRIE